jgi:hypothetical protein
VLAACETLVTSYPTVWCKSPGGSCCNRVLLLVFSCKSVPVLKHWSTCLRSLLLDRVWNMLTLSPYFKSSLLWWMFTTWHTVAPPRTACTADSGPNGKGASCIFVVFLQICQVQAALSIIVCVSGGLGQEFSPGIFKHSIPTFCCVTVF